MIIVKLTGGLGNQMFQYAFAKALESKGNIVKLDIAAFEIYKLHDGYQLDLYKTNLAIARKEELDTFYKINLISKLKQKLKISNKKITVEKSFAFDKSLLQVNESSYIEGYFQSEKYFLYLKNILLSSFILVPEISLYTKEIKSKIENSIQSCSIHIRRGDYINKTNLQVHGLCSLEYYKKAIKLMNKKFKNVNYFIFSDDIEWVKNNLNMCKAIYIDSKEKRLPHEDIYLMSLCNNNIIANSSFSWWGAWLNKNNEKIVIAPKRWFSDESLFLQSSDIVPVNWIKV